MVRNSNSDVRALHIHPASEDIELPAYPPPASHPAPYRFQYPLPPPYAEHALEFHDHPVVDSELTLVDWMSSSQQTTVIGSVSDTDRTTEYMFPHGHQTTTDQDLEMAGTTTTVLINNPVSPDHRRQRIEQTRSPAPPPRGRRYQGKISRGLSTMGRTISATYSWPFHRLHRFWEALGSSARWGVVLFSSFTAVAFGILGLFAGLSGALAAASQPG
ncbi:Uncharacterized protein PECH_004889 [Penicillium ucsense]|uniref:Uncharacterized protein n=1 Tax=Penicillium ucsense TaxID=2839758 RepID=A0A8J8W722_9EURO|nr:Uncharacterized protein PECM_006994 [Penicillium ucsense]KAF7736823.1 Uncharacterized protein PECH_004889 [Penicillium ucsense]